MIRSPITPTLLLVCFVACCASSYKTVISSDAPSTKPEEIHSSIDPLIHRDAQKAATLLRQALSNTNDQLAALAAVSVAQLRIKRDETALNRALVRGATLDDLLLAALCWRHLAASTTKDLPPWKAVKTDDDPVVRIFAFLAYRRAGKSVYELKRALDLPTTDTNATVIDNRPPLSKAALALDNGPLALALGFVAARRTGHQLMVDGVPISLAAQFRAKLLRAFGIEPWTFGHLPQTELPPNTKLPGLLSTPLANTPPAILRQIALKGDLPLRPLALRQLASSVDQPIVADLAVAAAALDNDDPRTQIEGARTFLLLVKKGTK